MRVRRNQLQRSSFVVQLLFLSLIATGCFSIPFRPSVPDNPRSEVAFLRSQPAYVFMGAEGEVQVTPSAYNVYGEEIAEPVRGEVRFIGALGPAQGSALLSTASAGSAAELSPDGTFRAEREGIYEIKFSNVDRSVELVVPVTVVAKPRAPVAGLVMEFTHAVENKDAVALAALVTEDFVLFSNLHDDIDTPEPVGTITDLLYALPVVASWKISDISVLEEGSGLTIVKGISTLETVEEVLYDGTIYGLTKSQIAFHIVNEGSRPLIREIHLEKIPVDDSNWPKVKARYNLPKGDMIRVGDGFEFDIGWANDGGSGYFAIIEELNYPGGSMSGWLEPGWIDAGSSVIGAGTGYIGLNEPGPVTFEIRVLSGPAPNQLVETDYQIHTYRVE